MQASLLKLRKLYQSLGNDRWDNLTDPSGIGSFCPPPGYQLFISMDTLIQGVHFPENTLAQAIGYKSLAVNLSDMAAMGAQPMGFALALTLPDTDHWIWISDFAHGMAGLMNEFQIGLQGLSISRGGLSVTVQVTGIAPHGGGLCRSGAKDGDLIYVSGSLGDAGAGLAISQGKCSTDEQHARYLLARLEFPSPRVRLGQELRNCANSAIDLSDGLVADLKHILKASDAGARVTTEQIPLSCSLTATLSRKESIELACSAGDDYELCYTVAPQYEAMIAEIEHKLKVPQTCIGRVEKGSGLKLLLDDKPFELETRSGFDHFADPS